MNQKWKLYLSFRLDLRCLKASDQKSLEGWPPLKLNFTWRYFSCHGCIIPNNYLLPYISLKKVSGEYYCNTESVLTGQCIVISSSPVNNVRHHYIMLVVLQESFLSKCSSEYFEYGYLERKVLRSTNIKDNNPSTPAQAIYYVKLTAPVVRPQPQGYHVHQLLNTSDYIIMKVIQLHL